VTDPLVAALIRLADAADTAWFNALVHLGYIGDGPEPAEGWREDPASYAA
jgi:hypothetical protein